MTVRTADSTLLGSVLTISPRALDLRIARAGAVLVMTALTVLAAQVSVPLPFTPVPFTFQPMLVLLGGAALGARLGAASQVLYLALGIAGLPVFAASPILPQGALRLLGPTGGYLMAYPLAAFVAGALAERGFGRSYWSSFAAMAAGLAIIFTSGTTGTPKGVMIAHDNWLATMDAIHRTVPRLEHRILSLLPLSHLFEQGIGLLYALDVGAHILYVRSVNPRVIFEAFRDHRVTSMIIVPQLLDVFWSAIEREVQKSGRKALFDRLRAIARRLPMPLRRLLFRRIHSQLGGEFRLFVSAGAFLPPALQQAWEDIGVIVLQGYGSSENGFGTCNSLQDHGPGTVGRPIPPTEMRIAEDGEVLFRGPTLFKGYWRDPDATARAIDPDGWYHTGDIGHLDAAGRLVLSGRTKDRIVLPNGFKVYPEDIENALRNAGIRESIALESTPGRIEVVVLGASLDGFVRPAGPGTPSTGAPEATVESDGAGPTSPVAAAPMVQADAELRARIDAAVRVANAVLGPNQRIAAWRLWPDTDFPRTHTLKVKRDLVRAWVAADRGASA